MFNKAFYNMDLNEAISELEEHGYILEKIDDNWAPSVRDLDRINRNRAPFGTKNLRTVKSHKRPSKPWSHSELAMQRVTDPMARKPYTEDDLRVDRLAIADEAKRICAKLPSLIDFDYQDITYDDHSVTVKLSDDVMFRIAFNGTGYAVTRFNRASIFDRASKRCEDLACVVQFMRDHLERS